MNTQIAVGLIVVIVGIAIGILPSLVVLALGKSKATWYPKLAIVTGTTYLVVEVVGILTFVYGLSLLF